MTSTFTSSPVWAVKREARRKIDGNKVPNVSYRQRFTVSARSPSRNL